MLDDIAPKMGTRWMISAKLAILGAILAPRWVQTVFKKTSGVEGMGNLGPNGLGRRQRRVQWEGKGGNKSHPGWTLECDSVVLHGYSSTRRCCAGLNTLRETTGAAPIRSRTSCAKPVQTYIKHVPKMLGSIPKSRKSSPGRTQSP